MVQIPAGVAIYSGKYNAVVEIDRKSTTAPWEGGEEGGFLNLSMVSGEEGIVIDRNTIGSYGVKAVESEIDLGGISVPVKTEYQLSPG